MFQNLFDGLILLDDSSGSPLESPMSLVRTPKVDVVDGESAVEIVADAPGYEASGIEVLVEDGTLTVSGRKLAEKDDKNGPFLRKERHEESFSRSFGLGDTFDAKNVKATLKDGVLRVSVPKIVQKPKSGAVKVEVKKG